MYLRQNERWNAIDVPEGELYEWDANSTYIQEPPFFTDLGSEPGDIADIHGASVLALLGDSVTTDHISPAGNITAEQPGRQILDRAWRARRRLQLLRLAPR